MNNFWESLFGVSIKKRVMAAVQSKIKAAQTEYDKELKDLEKAHLAHLEELRNMYYQSKEDVTERHVSSILSKLM